MVFWAAVFRPFASALLEITRLTSAFRVPFLVFSIMAAMFDPRPEIRIASLGFVILLFYSDFWWMSR